MRKSVRLLRVVCSKGAWTEVPTEVPIVFGRWCDPDSLPMRKEMDAVQVPEFTPGSQPAVAGLTLAHWRDRTVTALAVSAAALGVLAYPPSVWLSIHSGFWGVAIADTVAYAVVVLLAWRRDWPYRVRAGGLLVAIFGLSVYLLVALGMPGAGLLWLAMWPVFAALLGGRRVALASLAVLALTGIAYGLAIQLGFAHWAPLPGSFPTSLDGMVWTVNVTSALLLAAAAAFSVTTLLRGLQEVILTLEQEGAERVRAEGERTRLAEQLRQSQKLEAVGRLAGGIAHDFNNLLTPILVYTEEAREDLPADSRAAQRLSEVLRSAQRAGHLVQRILTFARHTVVARTSVRVSDVVREAGALLRATLPQSIDIRYEIAADSATVLADPAELHQVLINLGTNALDAMSAHGGTLLFRLAQSGGCVELTVEDSGEGMEPHVLEHAFEPFYTTKPQGKGTGLGLASVHGIVTSLGGQVWLTSERGRGTSVAISLPTVSTVAAPPIADGRAPIPRGNGERLLIVDDEPGVLGACEALLTRMGYRVTAEADPAIALARVREAPHGFDLVITDQSMPGMNGVTLAVAIHDLRRDLPVVLATGYLDDATRETLAPAGIRHVLPKPFKPSELGAFVQVGLEGA